MALLWVEPLLLVFFLSPSRSEGVSILWDIFKKENVRGMSQEKDELGKS